MKNKALDTTTAAPTVGTSDGINLARTYLVRHGATAFNGEVGDSPDKIRGYLDIPLSDQGRAQAQSVGDKLKDSGITMLFSSDLSRASETGLIMSKAMGGVPVLPLFSLRPWHLGPSIEGKETAEVLPQINDLIDNPYTVPDGGESFNDFQNRFMDSFSRHQADYKNETIGIVTHYRGLKLLDAWQAAGKTGYDIERFKTLDGATLPGNYSVVDKNGDIIREKSIIVPEILFRNASFDSSSVDEGSRTISMSVSSDAPYARGFGNEILDHSPDAIRLNRMVKGAPLLFNHDVDKHIGRIVDAQTDGKRLNVRAKFGNSALAREKFQDVKDGILKEASVGYAIHSMKLQETTDDGDDTYLVTDWEPYESSLVTVPADCTVGVGRSVPIFIEKKVFAKVLTDENTPIGNDQTLTNEKENRMAEKVAEAAAPEPKVDIVAEQKKWNEKRSESAKKINDFVATLKEKRKIDCSAIAMKHLADGCDFDAFRQEVLETEFKAKPVEEPSPSQLNMSKRERRQFSVVKMFRELGEIGLGGSGLTGIEKEACDSIRKNREKTGNDSRDHAGFTIPDDMLNANLAEDNDLSSRAIENELFEIRRLLSTRALQTTPGTAGGYLVATNLLTGSIVELLRNKALVMGLGPTYLGGLVGNIAIPKVMGGATVYWLPESGSVTESDQLFAQLTLTPHRMGADTAYTKQLINQASLSVEAFVRDDLARQMAVERDRVCINGSGAAGEPLGILNTTGVGTLTFGAAATWAKWVQFETDIEAANAILGPMAFLTTPAVKLKGKTAPKVGATFPIFNWEVDPNPTVINGVKSGMINGYMAFATKNVPSDKVLFGVWSELIIADWAGIDVVVDPYSLKRTEQIEVTIHQWMDVGLRHPVAFEISTDSGAQ